MTTPTRPEDEHADDQQIEGQVDEIHPPAQGDGPQLTASAERKVSDDLDNLTNS